MSGINPEKNFMKIKKNLIFMGMVELAETSLQQLLE